jgi:glycosyltransferase involved in cell wall biosynthesis
MRIVHYLNHTCRGNGHVAVAIDLACEQHRVGHDVYIVCGFGDFDEFLKAQHIKLVLLGEATGPLKLFIMAWTFALALGRIKPDVVNAHMVYAAIAARLVRPLFGFGLVTTVHNSFDSQANLMRVGDRVIVVSDAVGRDMAARGIPARKLRTVLNGTVGSPRRPAFQGPAIPLVHPALVSVCGLHSRKGVAHLIDAFDLARRTFPDARLYLVGGGPEQANLEAQARQTASRGHIAFLGYLPDPRGVLASADIFVLASLRDPCPLVLFEAREMANPIIATSVDGIPEALGHGRYGVLVPPADPLALAAAIVELLSDPARRAALGQAASADPDSISVRRMSHEAVEVYAETAPSWR